MAGIVLKIRKELPHMSKNNKNIANYILNNLEQFIDETAQEIAENSNSSSASVVRFARHIGYEGLTDMKRAAMIDLHDARNKNAVDPIISPQNTTTELVDKVQIMIQNSINDLIYQLDIDKLNEAIELIQKSSKIHLIGIGASSLPAYDLYHKFNRVGKSAIFDFDAHMTLEFLNYSSKDDVVVIFSYSGRSQEAVYATEIAHKRNIPSIVITRDEKSPIKKLATCVINVPNSESLVRVGAITSRTNSMLVADLLYLGVIKPEIDLIEKRFIETNKITQELKVKD